MRTSICALLTGIAALCAAGPARALTAYELVWTGTTGTGTTGSDVIAAQSGDVLTLDILLLSTDAISGWDADLFGSGVSAVSGEECPSGASSGSSTNLAAGLCTTDLGSVFQPLLPGVSVSGGDISGYDGAALVSAGMSQPLFIGRGVFVANGAGQVDLEVECPFGYVCPAINVFLPEATATIVPEPGTLALLGLGSAALGVARRRRR